MLVTDATFNTNHLNMPLSTLVGVTNTLQSFQIGYCFIFLESAKAFAFMNLCLRDLLFNDSYPSPCVIIGDFAAGLTAAMLKEQKTTCAEAGMAIRQELEITYLHSSSLDEIGTDCVLQLCSWHAAEAIKKRLITKGYPIKRRKALHDLIWEWIKSPTKTDLLKRRNALLAELHQKEKDYLISYYQP